jgi:hypothetical protein
MIEANYALGQHWDTLSGQPIDKFLHVRAVLTIFNQRNNGHTQGFYFSILSYNISLIFTKISILLLYVRILDASRTRYGCYILLGIVIAYGTWLLFSSIFPCVPVASFWDKEIPGHCLRESTVWFTNASLNIATEIAIFILPLRVISTLSLPQRQKFGVYFVFALGFLYVPPSLSQPHAGSSSFSRATTFLLTSPIFTASA